MNTYHPATAERMSANIQRDESSTSQPDQFCAMPRLMTQKDLAAYLYKSEAWCERARWAGEGPSFVKLGRNVRYRAEDVLAWIDSNVHSSTTSAQ
ncbi:helix-turn-helix transcriptional regulator [Pseudomonas sp. OIL-1]|uniref:helix-turn-helix transcriptional regulator n=1 Tax=Pseudomonas sp. OIL-1 TaxID=2706126 RepID=UPI00353184B2